MIRDLVTIEDKAKAKETESRIPNKPVYMNDLADKMAMENRAYVNTLEPDNYLNPTSDRGSLNPTSDRGSLNPMSDRGSLNHFSDRGSPTQRNTWKEKEDDDKIQLRQKNSAFDSGVGDLEHVHIDGKSNRPNTKMYDYADYGHQYEELPGGRKSIAKCHMDNGNDSQSEYQSSSGATIVSETDDTANIVRNNNDKRKRVNPLYDGMTQSMPSIYNKVKGTKDEGLKRQVQCLQCVLVILVIISCAALAISVFVVINSSSSDDDKPDLSPQVAKLIKDHSRMEQLLSSFQDSNDTMTILSDLIQKVSALEQNTSTDIGVIHSQIETLELDVHKSAEDLISTHNNLSQVISQLNTTIQLQLYNISKQEGPRGPQGVANFSQCNYFNVSNNAVASGLFASYSPWAPTETDLQTNFAIFAACSVDGGTFHMLETHAVKKNVVQYRCQCSGTLPDKSRRICYVHIVSCPRNS